VLVDVRLALRICLFVAFAKAGIETFVEMLD